MIWRTRKITGVTQSDFTAQQQVTEWQGDPWEVDVSMPLMTRTLAEPWIAAMESLDGSTGTFYMGPSGDERNPISTAGGTPLVDGASQSGKTLLLKGWTGTLKAGDFIQVLHDVKRLYRAVKDVAATSSIDIRPRLRTPTPADGAACSFSSPVGLFRLAPGTFAEWKLDQNKLFTLSFKAVEAI